MVPNGRFQPSTDFCFSGLDCIESLHRNKTTDSFDLHALKELMSAPKKRKSDVHLDDCAHDNVEHSLSKKEKHWFEGTGNEPNAENRRSSTFFKGIFKKMKSSTTLKSNNKGASSSSKLEAFANETQISITSESSVTSAESSSIVPNIEKNAGLRTFVNRDSFTPVPPPDEAEPKLEDAISVSSHMSVETIGSNHTIDEDSMSIGSTSAFCTPSRNPMHRNGLRTSTRSVPDRQGDDLQPALFRSLCNSAVRRVPNSKSDSLSTPMRRSMRMSLQKRSLNVKSMEDVPEEEALTVSSSSVLKLEEPIEEEGEQFGAAKEFFAANATSPHNESADEGQDSFSRLSTCSEAGKSSGSASIGRKSSIFRRVFSHKHDSKERRMSEVFSSDMQQDPTLAGGPRGRRASIVSFTNDCSFTGGNGGVNASVSVSSLASNESSQKVPTMRKKAPSTSNLAQRFSSVFRRTSTSTVKEDDVLGGQPAQSNRRSTLTGYSSISSGIGSIASGISDSGYGTLGSRSGGSISRSGSKREDESKRERSRRLLDRVVISSIPAEELIKLKIEQLKNKDQETTDELSETQLKESNSSESSNIDLLDFDVIAVDLKPDGSPFSSTAAVFMDERIGKIIRDEIRSNFRPDKCGTITDCEPELVFVCPEQPQCLQKGANDSVSSTSDVNSELLRNVRSGLYKAMEEWKKIAKDSSTMLIYPMFCESEAEWDSKATIDAIFLMLDGILQNAKRWRKNGKCLLAGLTANNVRLLQEKYDEIKQSVAVTEFEGLGSSLDEPDRQSVASTSTMFGTTI
ncbi:unnamed protein product [Caenorhabditis sp. 36 PRJEB53466]|nr:unnamed protein product [Caenorhabditis sp. 36 PRJEB53466]